MLTPSCTYLEDKLEIVLHKLKRNICLFGGQAGKYFAQNFEVTKKKNN